MKGTPQWPLRRRSETEEIHFDIQSLGFDRVFQKHPPRSKFLLFRMPAELFSHVMTYLCQSDLDHLAEVDEDCQRLCALYACKDAQIQYTSPTCDKQCSSIFEISHPECVRRLVVTPEAPRATPLLPRLFGEYVCEKMHRELTNLHILDWDCEGTIFPLAFFPGLASPGVQHLRVKGTVLRDEGKDMMEDRHAHLPLETLCLDTREGIPDIKTQSVVFDTLVMPAHSSLRQLIWSGNPDLDNLSFNVPVDSRCSFSHLRSLCLDRVSINCDGLLDLLLGPATRITTLTMDSNTVSSSRFYRTRGYLSYLTEFTWLHHDDFQGTSVADVQAFLSANPQLQAFHVPEPLPSWIIDDALIPLIEHRFALSSLHLVWASADIPEASLQTIAGMRSLRHLWISVGRPDAMRSTWEVDHEKMKALLTPLGAHLETLAFSKDTYNSTPLNAHPLAPSSAGFGDYYMNKVLPIDDTAVLALLSPDEVAEFHERTAAYARTCPTMPEYDVQLGALIHLRHLAWEKWHARAMLELARRYYGRERFSCLKWLFVGQMPMVVNQRGVLEHWNCPPQREPCLSSLQKRMSMTLWRPV